MGRRRKRVATGDGVPSPRKEEKTPAPPRKEKKKKTDIGKVFINISIGLVYLQSYLVLLCPLYALILGQEGCDLAPLSTGLGC